MCKVTMHQAVIMEGRHEAEGQAGQFKAWPAYTEVYSTLSTLRHAPARDRPTSWAQRVSHSRDHPQWKPLPQHLLL
nr:hypothetical protein CFP56_34721 [Quercus suber]